MRFAAVHVHLHRVAAVPLGLEGRPLPGVKAEQDTTAGPDHPPEVRQDGADLVVRDVDEREPGDQAVDGGVRQRQVGHGPHLEAHAGMVAPGHLDHPGREIDAEGRQAEAAQVGRDVPGPAPDIDDGPAPGTAHAVGEDAENAAHERRPGQGIPHEIGVVGCHRVVGRPCVRQPVTIAHAGDIID